MSTTKEQVAEVIEMARQKALDIKSTCFCHALSANRRPCVACESTDIILALCNALEISDAALDKTANIVREFAAGIKSAISESTK